MSGYVDVFDLEPGQKIQWSGGVSVVTRRSERGDFGSVTIFTRAATITTNLPVKVRVIGD